MALFDTAPDNQIIDFWLLNIREELYSAVSQKVSIYNFDFFKSEPSSSGRFDWSNETQPKTSSSPPQCTFPSSPFPFPL